MAVNLVDRLPIPGSLGAPVDQGVVLRLQETAGTIDLATVEIRINTVLAYGDSAFKPGFTGTAVADGSGGWIFTINPAADFNYDSTVTVRAICVGEEAGPVSVPFDQTYTFRTVRNIQISVNAEYVEESDSVNITIYPFEDARKVSSVVSNGVCSLYAKSSVDTVAPILVDSFSFTNERNLSAADGAFNVRFLHPLSIKESMTYRVAVTVDPYQAPNVTQVLAEGDVVFIHKTQSTHLDTQPQPYVQGETNQPRIQYEGNRNASFQIAEADYEKIDMANQATLPDVLVDLDFQQGNAFINMLEGSVDYSGGGNRLLRLLEDTQQYILQAQDDVAPLIGARLLSEPGTTNLYPDSALLGDLPGFTLSATDTSVITECDIQPFLVSSDDNETPLVNQLHFVFEGMAFYAGVARHAAAASPRVDYQSGEDVVISSLVRILYRDATVTLTNFKFIAQFFDTDGDLVFSSPVVYNPADFVSDSLYSLAEVKVASGAIPPTAVRVGFQIDFDSFESCDRIEVFMVGPSIEYGNVSTSRVVSGDAETVRLPDVIKISQIKNLNVERGMVTIEYAPLYDATPLATATMFDTRIPGTLWNGFTAFHRPDGFVEFQVVDQAGAVQSVVSGAAVLLPIGQPATFSFSWDTGQLAIRQGEDVIGTVAAAYQLPNGINNDLWIGHDADGANHLMSELLRFLVYSRPIA